MSEIIDFEEKHNHHRLYDFGGAHDVVHAETPSCLCTFLQHNQVDAQHNYLNFYSTYCERTVFSLDEYLPIENRNVSK